MQILDVLKELGGIATRRQLLDVVPRSELERALRNCDMVRLARNRYALAAVEGGVARAHAIGGVLCLTSAAIHHGWAVKLPPELPHVSVRANRNLTPDQRATVQVHRHALVPDDIVDGIVTTKEITLLQCLRSLPEGEALAIADSAARAGETALLRRVACIARGRGAARVRRLARAASAEAANPFESVLRSLAHEVEGLSVKPQVLIETRHEWVRPDLVDADLRIVLEADSFEWHGSRQALRRDARRYNLLVIDGWTVLRFAWEDVMFDQDHVREVLIAVVEAASGRTKLHCTRCPAA